MQVTDSVDGVSIGRVKAYLRERIAECVAEGNVAAAGRLEDVVLRELACVESIAGMALELDSTELVSAVELSRELRIPKRTVYRYLRELTKELHLLPAVVGSGNHRSHDLYLRSQIIPPLIAKRSQTFALPQRNWPKP